MWRSLRRTDHSSRGVKPTAVCLKRRLHEATLQGTRQLVWSPASERAENKLAIPVTRRNGEAGQ